MKIQINHSFAYFNIIIVIIICKYFANHINKDIPQQSKINEYYVLLIIIHS